MLRSLTPVGPQRLAMRTIEVRGESLLPTAFACGSLPLSVPQSAPDRCLAASRHFGFAPALLKAKGSDEK